MTGNQNAQAAALRGVARIIVASEPAPTLQVSEALAQPPVERLPVKLRCRARDLGEADVDLRRGAR